MKNLKYKASLLQKIVALYTEILLLVQKKNDIIANNKLYFTAKECLGKDTAYQEDEYGCAEAFNEVVRRATGSVVGGGASTYLLDKAIKKDKRFIKVSFPQRGDVILSASGWGNARKVPNGHVGIVSDNGKIMSNRSMDGLWSEHFTIEKWNRIYGEVGQYPIDYYRLI